MVGQWPPLSPYLFIQIIWSFKYEMILAESLMYIPLDLCVEILEIVVKCIPELEYKRAKHLIIQLTSNIYKRCLQLHKTRSSKENGREYAWQLVAYFQMLLDPLTDLRRTRFSMLPIVPETMYEEHGILIKTLLRHTKNCICMQGVTNEDSTSATFFTLGLRRYEDTLPVEDIKVITQKLAQELIAVLLNQIKKVDYFMKRDIFPERNDHLEECLKQFAGDRQATESVFTIQELRYCIVNGKLEYFKELMDRYKEWDESVLDFLEEHMQLCVAHMTKYNTSTLLEYVYVFTTQNLWSKLYSSFILKSVLRILSTVNVMEFYCIVLRYAIKHVHDNPLTELYSEKAFMQFVASNKNICEHHMMRYVLENFLLNTKAVTLTLTKILIGNVQVDHPLFTTKKIVALQSFFKIKVNNEYNVLISCLKKIVCITNPSWNSKRFIHFVDIMLQNEVISTDQLMNNVYISYLTGASFNFLNLMCVLLCIRDILKNKDSSNATNYSLLVIAILEILHNIFLEKEKLVNKDEIIHAINGSVEPLDQATIAPMIKSHGTVMEIIQDYEKRCFVIHTRFRTGAHVYNVNRRKLICTINLDRKSLIRHMILHATTIEYIDYMCEMRRISWFHFGWSSERNAFENIILITIEAMKVVMIYEKNFPEDKFVMLLLSAVKFCEIVADDLKDSGYVINVLLLNLATLNDIVSYTPYAKMFNLMLSRIKDSLTQSMHKYTYFRDILSWIKDVELYRQLSIKT
ncbi:hypothetical protein DMN91_001048 [Ooceraea biroi]|uniref:Uncharacterized protein n=1 Tax=Ooceraea biroi TaxID=2015173 RepID=A0A3L8E3I7_OOCBI|nr:hypothetical protein DMN91_001048 [Ooceraea biroi]